MNGSVSVHVRRASRDTNAYREKELGAKYCLPFFQHPLKK